MQTLHQDEYFSVTLDPAKRLVRVRRTAAPFPDLAAVERVLVVMDRLIREGSFGDHCLLVDSREAVGRNDEEFEQVMGRFRQQLFGAFERAAMLVQTVVGRLQADRMAREHGGPPLAVFQDEAQAEAYLLNPPG